MEYTCSRPECTNSFKRRPSVVVGKENIYCGRACQAQHKREMPRGVCNCGNELVPQKSSKGKCQSCYDKARPRAKSKSEEWEREKARRQAYYQDNPDKWRKGLLARFGLTVEDYDRLLESQDYRCAICKRDRQDFLRSFAVDHDHLCCSGKKSCGKCVRGLLCTNCNQGIGCFRDEADTMLSAVEYLRRGRDDSNL